MKTQKTWLTVNFYHGNAYIEVTLNYKERSFSLTHDTNDNNVTFNSNTVTMKDAIDRSICVNAALKFIKQELSL